MKIVFFCFVIGLAFAAFPAMAQGRDLRCDGADEQLFGEMKQAGETGYGETWDEKTCNQGRVIYTPGVAEAGGGPFRYRSKRQAQEQQALALVLPLVVVGGLAVAFAAAAAFAYVMRLKKRTVLQIPCPECDAGLPIDADAGHAQHLFCPLCGAPCLVDVTGRGKTAAATARVLA